MIILLSDAAVCLAGVADTPVSISSRGAYLLNLTIRCRAAACIICPKYIIPHCGTGEQAGIRLTIPAGPSSLIQRFGPLLS